MDPHPPPPPPRLRLLPPMSAHRMTLVRHSTACSRNNVRIAELYELRHFRIIEAESTPPGPGEIQVRVRSVGICGSDLHYFADGSIGDVKIHYPVVLGHEPTGEVVSAGSGVTGVSAGGQGVVEAPPFFFPPGARRRGPPKLLAK